MKRLLAGIGTLAVMIALLRAGATRRPETPPEENVESETLVADRTDPAESAIQALIDLAKSGEVSSYLDAFSGTLRARLDREVEERGREAFGAELRRASALRKSHAIFAAEPVEPDAAKVTVESVYPDRNERQSYRLERSGAAWLVTDVDTIKTRQPKARFGASASYIAPEGVPVQAGVAVETGDDPTESPDPGLKE